MKEKLSKTLVYFAGALIIISTLVLAYDDWQRKGWGDGLEVLFVGSLLFAMFIIVPIWQMKNETNLRLKGLRIEAQLVKVDAVENEKKQMEYVITAKARDIMTGAETEYYSEALNADPQPYLPDKLTILVDPQKSTNYIFDLDFLEKIEPEGVEGENG